MTGPASTHLSTHYTPVSQARRVELRRDNTDATANRDHGRYVVAIVNNSIAESATRYRTQSRSEDAIAELGYTESVAY